MKLPERWLAYSALHNSLDRFVPFKVPLSTKFNRDIPYRKRLTWPILLDILKQNNVSLGIVIDLCNTDRYYCEQEVADYEGNYVQHVKLKCPFTGHHNVPGNQIFDQFVSVVRDFLKTASPNQFIGVHCTHGVNRTGFFICKYLILEVGWEPSQAVDCFVQNRGHQFDKSFYVEHLLGLKSGSEVSTLCPKISTEDLNNHMQQIGGLGRKVFSSGMTFKADCKFRDARNEELSANKIAAKRSVHVKFTDSDHIDETLKTEESLKRQSPNEEKPLLTKRKRRRHKKNFTSNNIRTDEVAGQSSSRSKNDEALEIKN